VSSLSLSLSLSLFAWKSGVTLTTHFLALPSAILPKDPIVPSHLDTCTSLALSVVTDRYHVILYTCSSEGEGGVASVTSPVSPPQPAPARVLGDQGGLQL
jgi:hypothetical protein